MKRVVRVSITLMLLAVAMIAQSPAKNSTSKPKDESSQTITRQQADTIIEELRQIRQYLERQDSSNAIASELRQLRQSIEKQQAALPQQAAAAPAPPAPPQKVKFAVGPGPSLGNQDAKVVLIEYSDYQCPFCRAFHNGAYPEIRKNFIDNGKIKFISRDLPLEFHNNAAKAAQAARCAGEQNKFWELRDTLIMNAADLSSAAVLNHARAVGLDMQKFQACFSSDKYVSDIQSQASAAGTLGISGTPSFVIGRMNGDQIEGVVIVGALPYSTFESEINGALAK